MSSESEPSTGGQGETKSTGVNGPELARAALEAARRRAASRSSGAGSGGAGTGEGRNFRRRGYTGAGPDPRDPQLL
nr:DUF721 domain-containing protein [Longispora sp. (in: high G+C Gram-positive bacteria)]